MTNCDVFIRENMCDELVMKIHDTPNLRDATRVYVENHLNASKLKIQESKLKIQELNASKCVKKDTPALNIPVLEEYFWVDAIINHNDTHYLVRWSSSKSDEKENAWEPKEHMRRAIPDIVEAYRRIQR